MLGCLPPFTDEQIIKQLTYALIVSTSLNKKYRETIIEQKQLIKELNRYIKDNIYETE